MGQPRRNEEPQSQPRWQPWRSKRLWGVTLILVLFHFAASWVFRAQDPAVIGQIKRFNRRWLNPLMLRFAGGPHWYAARQEHRGRRTGRLYATPITVNRVPGGFAIPLPYGRDVDWARNLLAMGDGVLTDHGVRAGIGNPRIVSAEDLLPDLSPSTRRIIATYGIRDFMRVDELPDDGSATAP
jgi:hypothetical protein